MNYQQTSVSRIIGIGAVLVDEIFYCHEAVAGGTSNPALLKRSAGGVMRNIMHHLALLNTAPAFITVVGNDADGEWLQNNCKAAGIKMVAMVADCSTGKYAALLNPDGSLYAAACANECEAYLDTGLLQQHEALLSGAEIIIADTNLTGRVLQWLVYFCRDHAIKLIIETVSISKAGKLSSLDLHDVFMLTPNEDELAAICATAKNKDEAIDSLLAKGVRNIWLRSGAAGSAIFSKQQVVRLDAPVVTVKDTTGAGDAALAGWLAFYGNGEEENNCLKAAHALAAVVLETEGAIAENISMNGLENAIKKFYPGEE